MAIVNEELLKNLHRINMGKKATNTFTMDFSDINPEYVGSFTVHHPSQMEQLQVGILTSVLLDGKGTTVDVMTNNTALVIANLEVVLDVHPTWFDVYSDNIDYGMMEKVYLVYLSWMKTFRDKSKTSVISEDSQVTGSTDTVVNTETV